MNAASPPDSLAHHAWRRLRRSFNSLVGLGLIVFLASIAVGGPWLAPNDYKAQETEPAAMRAAPSHDAWFGRDALGRDIFSRVLHGAHLTLGVGVATVLVGLFIGGPIGLSAGYFGGRTDAVLMRAMDLLLAFPDYLLALAVMAALEPSLKNAMFAVGLTFVPKFARIVRASAMGEAGRDYVHAARALGASHPRILLRHVMPNCLTPLLVLSTLSLGSAILYTSALSFLGLGAQPPLPEWGAMLAEGRESFQDAPHLLIFPGAAIALSVLGVNLLGDGLRDALDVRL